MGAVPGQRGVVLVPGYLCNRGVWSAWLRRLEQQGRPFIALDLGPLFASIEDHVPLVDAAVTRMAQATGLPPLLVGHSMGGLVIRAWLVHCRAPERAHRLVTLGTPHHGTWLARWGHTRNARQMRLRSAWLQALAARTPRAWHAHFVCFCSDADNIVFPPSHAWLEGADNRLAQGLAHVQMVDDPAVMQSVLNLLEA
jgi:triacylglycerol esterase/lipase EstA (alpha/beta hydrolase family)